MPRACASVVLTCTCVVASHCPPRFHCSGGSRRKGDLHVWCRGSAAAPLPSGSLMGETAADAGRTRTGHSRFFLSPPPPPLDTGRGWAIPHRQAGARARLCPFGCSEVSWLLCCLGGGTACLPRLQGLADGGRHFRCFQALPDLSPSKDYRFVFGADFRRPPAAAFRFLAEISTFPGGVGGSRAVGQQGSSGAVGQWALEFHVFVIFRYHFSAFGIN
eukprot:gene24301-biopygen5907